MFVYGGAPISNISHTDVFGGVSILRSNHTGLDTRQVVLSRPKKGSCFLQKLLVRFLQD